MGLMKKIIIPYKKANFLFKYFWWVGFAYFYAVWQLTSYIVQIFELRDKLSLSLYECPGFFLCFIDYLPLSLDNISFLFKQPLLSMVWGILLFAILFPPLIIFMLVVEFEPYSKDMSKKKRSLAFFLKKKK